MKTKILSLFTLAVAALGLGSCDSPWEPAVDSTGTVSLSSIGVEVANAETVIKRSDYDVSNFIIKIYSDAGALVQQWTYSAMPEIFTLPVGDYRVDVVSHEVKKAEWEKPYFKGSKTFSIADSKITEIGEVKCVFSSLKVTVKFTDELREIMSDDVRVSVVANDQGRLEYLPDETRAGYFEVIDGSTTLAAMFTGTVKDYVENIHKVYSDVKAGQHWIITFDARKNPAQPKPETGTIDPADGVNVDVSVDDVDLNENIDIDEDPQDPNDRPGNEDFKDEVKADYESGSSMLNITAPAGLQSLVMSLSTPNEDMAAAMADINGVDIANPGAAAAALTGYGIANGADIAGHESVSLSLGRLVEAAREYEGLHRFAFAVSDAGGQTARVTVDVQGKAAKEPITFESSLRFDTPMNPSEEADGVVKILADAGIAKLVVVINSDNEDFASVTSVISGTDFARPGDMAETLTGFGLANGAEVLNQTAVDFDITTFLSPAFLPGFPGTHKFQLTVTDNDGNEKSVTLIFVVQ